MKISYRWAFKIACKIKLKSMSYDDIVALKDEVIHEFNVGVSQYDSEQLNILLKLIDKELDKRGISKQH